MPSKKKQEGKKEMRLHEGHVQSSFQDRNEVSTQQTRQEKHLI
jgi:hypothetical protein